MGIRKIPFVKGEYYHIYNRGVDKRIIFSENRDYFRFKALLWLCNSDIDIRLGKHFESRSKSIELFEIKKEGKSLVEIGAYCLMPNHFHLLIREKKEGGISIFMQKLSTAYSKYYNNKYSRSGALFQGRFKSSHVNNNNYLKYLLAYIHLNPVKLIDSKWKENGIKDKKKTKEFLQKYQDSSYLDFVGEKREQGQILETKNFPEYFGTFEEFQKFTEEWLSIKE